MSTRCLKPEAWRPLIAEQAAGMDSVVEFCQLHRPPATHLPTSPDEQNLATGRAQDPLGQALHYLQAQWPALIGYLDESR